MIERTLSPQQQKILELALHEPTLGDLEIARRSGLTVPAVKYHLKKIRAKGHQIPDRRGKRTPAWWSAAYPRMLKYRDEGLSWEKIGNIMGRNAMTLYGAYRGCGGGWEEQER